MTSALTGLASRMLPPLVTLGGERRLSILIYHRVLPARDPMRPGEPTVDEFRWQMKLLQDHFNALPLPEAVQRLQYGDLPPRAVCVTFDDGYADNATLALPVMRECGIPASVFVSTAYLNGGRMWNDTVIEAVRNLPGETLDLAGIGLASYRLDSATARSEAAQQILRAIKHLPQAQRQEKVEVIASGAGGLPEDLMLCDDQVRELADAGIDVGAHTVTHPILTRLDPDEAEAEISGSKAALESLLQREIRSFAYPNGQPGQDYDDSHRDMVASAGFSVAVSTHWGVSTPASDPYQLPRFTPWDRTELRFALRLVLNTRRTDPLLASL